MRRGHSEAEPDAAGTAADSSTTVHSSKNNKEKCPLNFIAYLMFMMILLLPLKKRECEN